MTNYIRMGASQGWQCPICGRILSPWTQECPCKGDPQSETIATSASTSTTINLDDLNIEVKN